MHAYSGNHITLPPTTGKIESHVRVKQTYLNIVRFWKTFVTRKMSTILKSGLYRTMFMNKKRQVSHSKQRPIGLISHTLPTV